MPWYIDRICEVFHAYERSCAFLSGNPFWKFCCIQVPYIQMIYYLCVVNLYVSVNELVLRTFCYIKYRHYFLTILTFFVIFSRIPFHHRISYCDTFLLLAGTKLIFDFWLILKNQPKLPTFILSFRLFEKVYYAHP